MDQALLDKLKTWEANALLFLRARGVVTLGEFLQLPPERQVALARAGDKYTFALAALTGLAGQGQKQALAVLRLADGGKIEGDASLAALMAEMLSDVGMVARGGA